MKILIASDHAAYSAKKALIEELSKDQEYEVINLGTDSEESVHYPEYALSLVQVLSREKDPDRARGILLCGSGIGICMAANKFQGIRAALCRDIDDAKLSREHNNSNILCLGARKTSLEEIFAITKEWLSTPFGEGRHRIRVDMLDKLGQPISSLESIEHFFHS